MKQSKRLVIFSLMILTFMVFAAAGCSSDSGVADQGSDGDGIEGDLEEFQPCTANIDCKSGCWCQIDHCVCPDVDGDEIEIETSDGDGNTGDDWKICVKDRVDFGAVAMKFKSTQKFDVTNCGTKMLNIVGMQIVPDPASPGNFHFEFGLEGVIPSETNIIELGPGTAHTVDVTYTPVDPGIDFANMIVASNGGVKNVKLESKQKGVPKVEVKCYPLDEEFIFPGQDQDKYKDACSFGLVPVGTQVAMQLDISNSNTDLDVNAVLVVNNIEKSDPLNTEFVIDKTGLFNEKDEIWIEPNNKSTFSILYQPQQRGFDEIKVLVYHNAEIEKDGTVTMKNPQEIMLIGAGVVPELAINPYPTINLGNIPKGKCNEATVVLSNRGGAPLTVKLAEFEKKTGIESQVFNLDLDPDKDGDDNIGATLVADKSDANNQTTIAVGCCPAGREAYGNMLNVYSNNLSIEDSITSINVTCTGIEASCEVYPSKIDFGPVAMNIEHLLTLKIINNGRATARVEKLSITPETQNAFLIKGYDGSGVDIAPGSVAELLIGFTPDAETQFIADLHIEFREGDCKEFTVQLNGNGIQPKLGGYPDACLKWEDIQVPPTDIPEDEIDLWKAEKKVELENSGSAPLTIDQVYMRPQRPPEEEEFILSMPAIPSIIPPGGKWIFHTDYKPKSSGTDFAWLVVCSNAANANGSPVNKFTCDSDGFTPHEICFDAQGVNPKLEVQPFTHEMVFTGVFEGQVETRTVHIQNSGSGTILIKDIAMDIEPYPISIAKNPGTQKLLIAPHPDDWPPEGYPLKNTSGAMTVTVQFAPPITTRGSSTDTHRNDLVITHNDKDALRFDMKKSYPDFEFQIVGTSGTNNAPVAIVKSPANATPGANGTLERLVEVGDEIELYGGSSKDPDDDPNTPVAEDAVVYYKWSVLDTGGIQNGIEFTTSLIEGADTEKVNVRLNKAGVYTVLLEVKDKHDEWSDTEDRDSKLIITAITAPTAVAFICDNYETSAEIESGEELCFDGSKSFDPDASDPQNPIKEYRWNIIKKDGNTQTFTKTNANLTHVFETSGEYTVQLIVADYDDNVSIPENNLNNEVSVIVTDNESLKIETYWSGNGVVDLHYIKPGGGYDQSSDCRYNNTGPRWGNYGNPEFIQKGDTALGTPDVVNHPDPGDGTYTVTAHYRTPDQQCGNVTECQHYSSNCDICDCDCKPFCLLLKICCNSCDVCEPVWKCENVRSLITYKIYTNDSDFPTCNVSGAVIGNTDYDAKHSFNLIREKGKWKCP